MFKKTIRLVSIILVLWAATLAENYFWRSATGPTLWPHPSFVYTFTIFAVGLMTFVGFLSISRDLRGKKDTFQDGDVRFALTCSFVTVFLALLSFFSFTRDEPTEFARLFFKEFLNITALIVGFYFATTAAIEFARMRQNGKGKERDESGAKPVENHDNQE